MCNRMTQRWEIVGAVHAPTPSPCGEKPAGMSASAICDANTGTYKEIVVVTPPDLKQLVQTSSYSTQQPMALYKPGMKL